MRLAVVLVALAVGCTNEIVALSSSEMLIDVTTTQAAQECRFLASQLPQKQVACGLSTTTIGVSVADCDTSAGDVPVTCTATVGDFDACATAQYDDPCGSNGTATMQACQPLEKCGNGL